MTEFKKEPKLSITDLVIVLMVNIFLLLMLFVTYLAYVNNAGYQRDILNVAFQIELWIFEFVALMSVIAGLIQLLRWITYQVFTPKWLKGP